MKRFKLLVPALLALVSCSPYIYASNVPVEKSPISINIDQASSSKIITYEGKTFFPVRLLNDQLAYKLSWDTKTKSTLLESEKTKVSLTANQKAVKVNDTAITLLAAPVLIDNILYAPAELWDKAFNLNVSAKDNTIVITSKENSTTEPNITPEPEVPVNPDVSNTTTDPNTNDNKDAIVMPMFEGSNTYYTEQKLSIRLEENPSTAYKWEVVFPEGIEVISDSFASGERTWIIRAVKEGNYTIEFNKLRPLEPDTIIDTKTFKLKAKSSAVPQI